MFFKIGDLKSFAIFTGKYLSWSLFLTSCRPELQEGLQLYYKENPIQVPSCEYCDISKNSFFLEQLWCMLLCWVKKHFLFYELLASHYFRLSFHSFTFFSYILQFLTYSLLVRGLTGIFVWRKFELKHKPAFFNICFDGTVCSKWLIIKKIRLFLYQWHTKSN